MFFTSWLLFTCLFRFTGSLGIRLFPTVLLIEFGFSPWTLKKKGKEEPVKKFLLFLGHCSSSLLLEKDKQTTIDIKQENTGVMWFVLVSDSTGYGSGTSEVSKVQLLYFCQSWT
jgi:hypothetical protein